MLGGDMPVVVDGVDYTPVWRAMAAGIAEGLGYQPLMTYHSAANNSSAQALAR